MQQLVKNAAALLAQAPFTWAICGRQAADLFLGRETRVHSDIDILAFLDERNTVIDWCIAGGWKVYEMLGGGKCHRLTRSGDSVGEKNIFAAQESCPLFKLYPTEEPNVFGLEFFHTGQQKLDFVEFLFDTRENDSFCYRRNPALSRPLEQSLLRQEGVLYLAPEWVCLYKSTDTERPGYKQDFRLLWEAMSEDARAWLAVALRTQFPEGHPWLMKD